MCIDMPTPTPNLTYKQCDDESDDDTVIASNCTYDNIDNDTAITQPTSESETEEDDFL